MFYQNLNFPVATDNTEPTIQGEMISSKSNVRESMATLPQFMQPFLTWLTAVPLKDQAPSNHSSLYHLSTALITISLGFVLCKISLNSDLSFLLKAILMILGMSFSLSSMRKLQVVIVHHCSHQNFFHRKSPWNSRLGTSLSFLLSTEPFHAYQKKHIHDHHFTEHMTEQDPTVQFLFDRVELRPGMRVKDSLNKLLLRFLSPGFYLETFLQRLKEQKEASLLYRFVWISFWCGVITTSLKFHFSLLLICAYFIPLFILYPVSSALRLVVEHTFPEKTENRKFDLGSHSFLTNAVFCGESYPEGSIARVLWFTRLLVVHLPTRFLILVGDTPVHDHHHRHPLYPNWPNYAYARRQEINRITLGYSAYREVWGYGNALIHSLKSLELQETSKGSNS